MRRRAVISFLFGVATVSLARIRAGRAQQSKVRRLAIVAASDPVSELVEAGSNRRYGAFLEELRRLGDVEGQNLVVERYSGEGLTEHSSSER